MKIAYLSTSRLPTEKAYGVTVLESARAARNLGIDYAVYSPGLKEDLNAGEITYIPRFRLPPFLEGRKVNALRKAIFLLNSILIPINAYRIKGFQETENIWLRDAISALVLAKLMPSAKILLEVHHRPVGLSLLLFKKLSSNRNLSFAAISPRLIHELGADVPGITAFEAPMGVPNEFFSRNRPKVEKSEIRFLYIGKGESSGFDNGIDVLLEDFVRAIETRTQISITFLGLEKQYKEFLLDKIVIAGIDKDKVIFIDHIPHNQVPFILSAHDVGVLPYPISIYNNERFPIKSLEYAAAELTILASEIDSHLEIIGRDNAYFYSPGEASSFESQVESFINDPASRFEKIARAKAWAERFTYEKRIKGVVSRWLGENS